MSKDWRGSGEIVLQIFSGINIDGVMSMELFHEYDC